MTLTIAIPSYQRREHIDRLLDSIEEALSPDTISAVEEVLIVLDGSTDGSKELIEGRGADFPVPLRAVWQPNAGPATARNRCADEVRSELLWFLDDDMIISDVALATHLAWDRSKAPVMLGPCHIRSDDPAFAVARAWYDERWTRLEADSLLTDPNDITFANASMPAALARQHRFSDRFKGYGPEDHELAVRMVEAGVAVGYAAAAGVEHVFTPSSDERLRKLREEGRNRLLFVELHPDHEAMVFPPDAGRLERSLRWASARRIGPVLWPVAQVVAVAGRLPVGGRVAARLQTVAEAAALYSGVASARRQTSEAAPDGP